MSNPTTQAYEELEAAFDHFNAALFNGQLPHCLITLQRKKRTYGYFSSKRFVRRHDKVLTDEIAMNPAYFAVVPMLEILQTLVHEMTHAWQFHFGKPGRRGYHNKEWANKMESIGLMPSSTGQPGGAKTGEKIADYAIAGGRFMQAADELMADGFGISWLDRFPVRLPSSMPGAVALDSADDDNMAADADTGLDDELAGLLVEQSGNKSNRVKYRCASCGVQAWGKPGLRLLCGVPECKAAELLPVE